MVARRFGMTYWLLAVSAGAIAITAAFLLLGTPASVHAQGRVVQVADLAGEWSFEIEGCSLEDVINPVDVPTCDVQRGSLIFDVKAQNGRAFAGTLLCPAGECGDHLTGAIGEDGRVSMQSYRDNDRKFFDATLFRGPRKRLQMTGVWHSFEDLTRARFPGMSTHYFTATKKP